MKQIFLYCIFSACFVGCNSHSSYQESSTNSIAGAKKLAYPFTPKYSINWRPGDESNALLVLNCLKKYVEGDIKACVSYFADTAEFIADKFYFRGSRDSLESVIGGMRNASSSVAKDFDSWMTTYYPDKDDTWVTLWYTERMTDKAGRQDSIYYTDDVLIKNGKIVQYDEKQRLFAR